MNRRDIEPQELTNAEIYEASDNEPTLTEFEYANAYRPSKSQAVENILKGIVGEVKVSIELKEEGYKTARMQFSTPITHLNEKGIRDLLKDYDCDVDELIDFFKKNQRGLPDYICKRNGKISFVEVKTNNSKLSPVQMSTISILRQEGFTVSCRRVQVKLNVEDSHKKMKQNREKYPVDKVKGLNKKYNEY